MCTVLSNATNHLPLGQSFLGRPAEMERKGCGHVRCIRAAPTPLCAPLASGGTRIMGTKRQRTTGTPANKEQVKRWEAGAQWKADGLWGRTGGARRRKCSKAWVWESQQGEAAYPVRMWGRAQTSCRGKQQNGTWWLWKEEGREIPS